MEFEVGDNVQWSSQSMGTHKTKRGKVVAVVPENCYPRDRIGNISGDFSQPVFGYPRKTKSYLVLVPSGTAAKPRLYWPVVSLLTKAE